MSDGAYRVTVKQGRDRRVLVFEENPMVKVGEEMKLNDGTGIWRVIKVERTEIIARVPRG